MPIQWQENPLKQYYRNKLKIALNGNVCFLLALYGAVSEATLFVWLGLKTLLFASKENKRFFRLSPWIHAHLYSPVDFCWTWALCGEEKLTLLLFLFKYIHINFMMSVKNASHKPFVSQKQWLSAVINTTWNLSQSLLSPSRSSDLSVLSCPDSPSLPAKGICPCHSST